jgi:biotin synthase-related radical SAM superfamily protein
VTFASHSWEQYYQAVRRCWRFGQTQPVDVHVIATEGEVGVLANLRRKANAADRMFESLVRHMGNALAVDHRRTFPHSERIPAWLSASK